MCLFLRLLLIVFISTQLLKEAVTTTNTKVTKSTAVTAFTNTSQTTKSEMEIGTNVAQTSLPSVNEITSTQPKSPSSGFLQIPSSSQSGKTAQLVSTTLHTTTITQRFSAPSSLQISTENRTIPTRTATEMNTTSSVNTATTAFPHIHNTLISSSRSCKSRPESVSQSTPSADLNATQSKASSYITGVPNPTLSINSSYATSLMIFPSTNATTTKAVHFTSDHSTRESSSPLVAPLTTAQTSSPSVKDITTTQQNAQSSVVLHIPSSFQSGKTTHSASPTINATKAGQRFSPSSGFQISSNNQTTMNTTSSVDAGTNAVSHAQNTLISFSMSRKSRLKSVLQSTPFADLNATRRKASGYTTGDLNRTLSLHSSYAMSPMTFTKSGAATTQAVYFTSDHTMKESSPLLVAPSTTASKSSTSVNGTTTTQQKSSSSGVLQIPSSFQSGQTTQAASTTINATTATQTFSPSSSFQISSNNQRRSMTTATAMNTTSSVDAGTNAVSHVQNTLISFSMSRKSRPKSVLQSTPFEDLNTTQSKASSYTTGVLNRTLSLHSSYAMSLMTFTKSGAGTTQAVYFTSDHTLRENSSLLVTPPTTASKSSPSVNGTIPTQQKSSSSGVLQILSSFQSGQTTQSASTTINATTATQTFSPSSSFQISSNNQTRPMRKATAMNTTPVVDAGTTAVSRVQNTLISFSMSRKSRPKSVLQSTPFRDLNATQSKASSYTNGVPNRTLSLHSSYAMSPMTFTKSGAAKTQVVYFTSDHTIKESSSLLIAPSTTALENSPSVNGTTPTQQKSSSSEVLQIPSSSQSGQTTQSASTTTNATTATRTFSFRSSFQISSNNQTRPMTTATTMNTTSSVDAETNTVSHVQNTLISFSKSHKSRPKSVLQSTPFADLNATQSKASSYTTSVLNRTLSLHSIYAMSPMTFTKSGAVTTQAVYFTSDHTMKENSPLLVAPPTTASKNSPSVNRTPTTQQKSSSSGVLQIPSSFQSGEKTQSASTTINATTATQTFSPSSSFQISSNNRSRSMTTATAMNTTSSVDAGTNAVSHVQNILISFSMSRKSRPKSVLQSTPFEDLNTTQSKASSYTTGVLNRTLSLHSSYAMSPMTFTKSGAGTTQAVYFTSDHTLKESSSLLVAPPTTASKGSPSVNGTIPTQQKSSSSGVLQISSSFQSGQTTQSASTTINATTATQTFSPSSSFQISSKNQSRPMTTATAMNTTSSVDAGTNAVSHVQNTLISFSMSRKSRPKIVLQLTPFADLNATQSKASSYTTGVLNRSLSLPSSYAISPLTFTKSGAETTQAVYFTSDHTMKESSSLLVTPPTSASKSSPSVNGTPTTQQKSSSSEVLQIPSSFQSGEKTQSASTTINATTATQTFSPSSSFQISSNNQSRSMTTATAMNTTSSVDAGTKAVSHVQNTLISFSMSRKSRPKSVLQSTLFADLNATQSKASSDTTGVLNRTLSLHSNYAMSPMTFTKSGPGTTRVLQSRPTADLNATQSKASSCTTCVPNLTLSINSSYATSTMFFTNSSAATTQAVYFISDRSPKESSTFPVALSTTAQTSSPSVNRITPTQQKSPHSGVLKIPSSSQSRQTTQSTSTTLNAPTATQRFSPSSSFQISSNNQTRPMRTATAMNTTLSVDAVTTADSHVQNTLTSFSTSRKSQPESVLQSTPSADLNATQSKASSYTTGVLNLTLSINSSYATSTMFFINSSAATTQAVYFVSDHSPKDSSTFPVALSTTAQTSFPSVNRITPTQQKSPYSGVLKIPSSSQSRQTTQSTSTTLNATTATQRFSPSSSFQISSNNQTRPMRTATAMNTTLSVDAGTTADSHVQNTLTSFSTSRKSQPESVLQLRPSADLNATQSKASNHTAGVPNRTLSINLSYTTSPLIFTNSGAATTQVLYFTGNHLTKESSSLLVAPSTTAQTSFTPVNGITPTQQKSSSSRVLQIQSSSQSGQGNIDAGTTAVPHVQNTLISFSTSRKSQPQSILQSAPSADLNATQSKASSYTTGIPNRKLSINSSYATSTMIFSNTGATTTQAVYFTSNHLTKESSSLLAAPLTTAQASSPSVNGITPTQLKSPSLSVLQRPLSSRWGQTIQLLSTTLNRKLSINSSYGTSLIIFKNSGSATTQATYFRSDHSTKESSLLLVAPTTTASSTKLTSTISGINSSR